MSNPRLNITVTLRQQSWLTKEAKKLGITVGELVRRILDAWRAR